MQQVTFPSGSVDYYFQSTGEELSAVLEGKPVIFVTDENVFRLHANFFDGKDTLVIPPGEGSKRMETITHLAGELLNRDANRDVTLVGVGGGVITDITGFLASVYMRGIRFGFVPTTLLAMTDAAVGGKNGVNLGLHKNIIGTIRQPEFILFDSSFLPTLPDSEWSNGFAEVIKYAVIFDAELYAELQQNDLKYYKDNSSACDAVVSKCVAWKNKTVIEDERERSVRKLLNFGHTVAHAIENLYELSHGVAVGIGMIVACRISEAIIGLEAKATIQLQDMLVRYGLPVHVQIDVSAVMELLKSDKKRKGDTIDYILLNRIGSAVIHPLQFAVVEKALNIYASNHPPGEH